MDELQDDVFEGTPDDHARGDKVRKSPRKSDKLYVQKKNKFEVTSRQALTPSKSTIPEREGRFGRR